MNQPPQNNQATQLWKTLLDALDEKLQLGLLELLKRSHSYDIEDGTLCITPVNEVDEEYLRKDETSRHLLLIAEDSIGVTQVTILPTKSNTPKE